MSKTVLTGLPYYGGKNPLRSANKWIRSIIGYKHHRYVEPFCGMMGVLLTGKAKFEIANDLNHNIVTWWKVLRDQPDEFHYALKYTPDSELLWMDALDYIKNERGDGSIEHAVHVHILLAKAINPALGEKLGSIGYRNNLHRNPKSKLVLKFRDRQYVERMSERLQNVQLLNKDALEIVQRVRTFENTMIYLDPPYAGKVGEAYGMGFDTNRLSELLVGAKARIAISGYLGDFDHLESEGFIRKEFCATSRLSRMSGKDHARTECLWINFADRRDMQLDLF